MPRADYLGSATNQIMILSTALPLIAGRFGLAPTSTRSTNAGLKLSDNKTAGLISNDPAGEWINIKSQATLRLLHNRLFVYKRREASLTVSYVLLRNFDSHA